MLHDFCLQAQIIFQQVIYVDIGLFLCCLIRQMLLVVFDTHLAELDDAVDFVKDGRCAGDGVERLDELACVRLACLVQCRVSTVWAGLPVRVSLVHRACIARQARLAALSQQSVQLRRSWCRLGRDENGLLLCGQVSILLVFSRVDRHIGQIVQLLVVLDALGELVLL